MIQPVIMLLQYRGSSHSAENGPHFPEGLQGLLVVLLFLDSLDFCFCSRECLLRL